MKNILVGILVIGGLAFLVLLLNPLMGGLHDFETNNTTAAFSVTTNGTETAKNVTLPLPLYGNDIQFASVSSNTSTDTPLISLYTSASRLLQISGLAVSTTHNLTVTYDVGVLNAPTQAVANNVPTFFMFVLVGLLLLAVVAAVMAITRR